MRTRSNLTGKGFVGCRRLQQGWGSIYQHRHVAEHQGWLPSHSCPVCPRSALCSCTETPATMMMSFKVLSLLLASLGFVMMEENVSG